MVTIFTKSGCPQCQFTRRKLDDLGVPFTTIDLDTDPAARATVRALGYQSVPVVVTDTGESWSGFRPTRLEALARREVAAA